MNRLARKYRDMGEAKPKASFQMPVGNYGFIIDRKGAATEEPEKADESDVEPNKKRLKDEIDHQQEETKEESSKNPFQSSKKWLADEDANEQTLEMLEKAVFVQPEKLAETLISKRENSTKLAFQDSDYSSSEDDINSLAEDKKTSKKSAAWADEDEEEELSAANREKYDYLVGQPRWAQKAEERLRKKQTPKASSEGEEDKDSSSSDDDEDEEGFRKMRDYMSASTSQPTAQLPGGQILQFARCGDLNQELRHFAQITAVDFYPHSTLALVASHDSTLKLFQVDGKKNALVHSIVMKQWPIQHAQFNGSTHEIVLQCAVPQPSFYCYDLMAEKMTLYNRYKDSGCAPFHYLTVSPDGQFIAFSSRNGYIHVISTRTKELLFDLKRNGEVSATTFVGNKMFASGKDNEIFVWDIRQQRSCLNRFNDSGCIHSTCISASPDGKFLVCGSDSGILNMYDLEKCVSERDPKPLKVFKNITTPVSGVVINHSSELMAAFSSQAPRVAKAIHLGSRSVFANFPEPEDMRLKNITAAAISPNSGFMALGNSKGRVLLWRLRHFSNY